MLSPVAFSFCSHSCCHSCARWLDRFHSTRWGELGLMMVVTGRFVRIWLLLSVAFLGLLGACSFAESGERYSGGVYDKGSSWTVYIEEKGTVCSVSLRFWNRTIFFGSQEYDGNIEYFFAIVDEIWIPAKSEYRFKVRNEEKTLISANAEAWADGSTGYWKIEGLSEQVMKEFIRSRALHVESDGKKDRDYDLATFDKGLRRFGDCLREVGSLRTPSGTSPKPRRMN